MSAEITAEFGFDITAKDCLTGILDSTPSFRNIKLPLILIIFLGFCLSAKAQQFNPNTEAGVLLGGSYYLGDLNTTHFNIIAILFYYFIIFLNRELHSQL